MKSKFLYLILGWAAIALSCSDDNKELAPESETGFEVTTPESDMTLEANKNTQIAIDFYSEDDWIAKVDADWLTVAPMTGKGGENSTIAVIAKNTNLTGEERMATLTLEGSGAPLPLTIRQKATDVLEVEQTLYEVPAEGGDVTLKFTTSFTDKEAHLWTYTDNVTDWISPSKDADMNTKALIDDSFIITVQPNDTREEREAIFQIYIADQTETSEENVDMVSPRIVIRQSGQPVGTSTDLTTHDKEVVQLQTHTEGTGVPIVLMGDGFIDTEIASGFYREVMEQSMENLFTEEPLKGLRNYFDVWMVTAVSLNNAFNDNYSTKFGCSYNSAVSTEIIGSNSLVEEYAQAVPQLASDAALFDEALLIVILNTEAYAGTTYLGLESTVQTGSICERAIAYCPTVEGVEAERFRQVLVHEAMGHGLGKLIDEYSYEQNGEIPSYLVNTYRERQALGWFVNADFTNDPTQVLWNRFLADSRYQGVDPCGQTLGLYQGACTYWTGTWRPTDDSMMRHNQNGFNAPSREAIYKRVMSAAYGSNWMYDYDEFTAFDQIHLPQPAATTKAAVSEKEVYEPLPAPRIVNQSLQLYRKK